MRQSPALRDPRSAFMVASEWQGQGLGTALQARLQEYAIGRGVRGFIAEMLPRNARMLRLATHAPGTVSTSRDEESVHVTILFQNKAPGGGRGGAGEFHAFAQLEVPKQGAGRERGGQSEPGRRC